MPAQADMSEQEATQDVASPVSSSTSFDGGAEQSGPESHVSGRSVVSASTVTAPGAAKPTASAASDSERDAPETTEPLDDALRGASQALVDMMAFAKPQAFGRAQRIAGVVREIAEALGIEKRWDVDLAGVLSQLATISLSSTILDKLDRGAPLSSDERLTMVRVPGMSAQLLARVPGADALSRAIRASGGVGAHPTDEATRDGEGPSQDPLAVLPLMIRVAVDFDQLTSGRVPVVTAIDQLRRRNLYSAQVLDALETAYLSDVCDESAPTELALDDLEPGMVFAGDVVTTDAVLLVSRGATVTNAMIRRLSNYTDRGECTGHVLVLATTKSAA